MHTAAARFIVDEAGLCTDVRPPAFAPAAPRKFGAQVMREKRIRTRIAKGETLYAADGTGYVASNVTWSSLTLRLAIPKVRGKAAHKAAKRERHRRANVELRRQAQAEARV